MEKLIPIKITFSFNTLKPDQDNKQARIDKAKNLIIHRGGIIKSEVEETRNDNSYIDYVLLCEIWESIASEHIGFDHVLNKAYPDGCGAAEVWGLEN